MIICYAPRGKSHGYLLILEKVAGLDDTYRRLVIGNGDVENNEPEYHEPKVWGMWEGQEDIKCWET